MTTGMTPNGGDVERRLTLMEKGIQKIDAKLDRLIESVHSLDLRCARIEDAMSTKASAAEVAGLRGTVRVLPNIWQLITLVFGILAGAFAIVRFGLPHP